MAACKVFFVAFVAVLSSISAFQSLDMKTDGRSPQEIGDKFQGDIVLTPEQESLMNGNSRGSRTGLLDKKFRWPKNMSGKVVVPYTFQSSAGFTNSQKKTVYEGLRELESHTCIRFVKRTYQKDYVQIINDDGCYSNLGRIGGKQPLSLNQEGCVYKGTVMHEFIHALGYDHMHNHIDRDDYVIIHTENVDPDMRFNFDKVDPAFFGNFDTPYDLLSVMHYPRWAFSNNGKDAIEPIDRSYIDKIGASELTDGDIDRINNMYDCKV